MRSHTTDQDGQVVRMAFDKGNGAVCDGCQWIKPCSAMTVAAIAPVKIGVQRFEPNGQRVIDGAQEEQVTNTPTMNQPWWPPPMAGNALISSDMRCIC